MTSDSQTEDKIRTEQRYNYQDRRYYGVVVLEDLIVGTPQGKPQNPARRKKGKTSTSVGAVRWWRGCGPAPDCGLAREPLYESSVDRQFVQAGKIIERRQYLFWMHGPGCSLAIGSKFGSLRVWSGRVPGTGAQQGRLTRAHNGRSALKAITKLPHQDDVTRLHHEEVAELDFAARAYMWLGHSGGKRIM
ncbi:hypothetical protein ACJ72_02620 [Emergomyces africanus]|uniref:Uncharacterized protein n=1 Tax=Emergomyces africanus TaxID=1955775 RepID=A0A1B7P1W5_9EURO|nr:hypothetical protein ACJ72_02620 [Emergomyces africanus]